MHYVYYFDLSVMAAFTLATHRIYEHDCDSIRREIHWRRRTAVLGGSFTMKLIWSRPMHSVAKGI